MTTFDITTTITECQTDELTADEHLLVERAILATDKSYAPYSNFHVGAALMLADGTIVEGCNQENAAYPVCICAERSALFAAGAQHPDQPVTMMAIAARNAEGHLQKEPVTPCGSCRQALVETETRFRRPVRLLLYGQRCVYIVDDIRQLMPLTFTEYYISLHHLVFPHSLSATQQKHDKES